MSSEVQGISGKYRAWEPIPDIDSSPLVSCLVDKDDGLSVFLSFDGRCVSGDLRLFFESCVAYRNINESYRLKTWMGFGAFRWPGGLYTVSGSDWVAWLKAESNGVLDHVGLNHYCIFTDEDCVEVVTEFPPEIDWSPRTAR